MAMETLLLAGLGGALIGLLLTLFGGAGRYWPHLGSSMWWA